MRALMEMVQGPKDERRAGLVWGGGKGGQWGRSREREREREDVDGTVKQHWRTL